MNKVLVICYLKKLSKSVLLIQVSNNVKSLIENINLILLYHDSHYLIILFVRTQTSLLSLVCNIKCLN